LPTNGAPPRPVTRSSSSTPVVIGIIIGALLIIPVAGILAAIAIPNLLTAMQRSKQKRTMADMRSLAAAAEAYGVDTNKYPDGDSVESLRPLLVPKYARSLPSNDGWGHPIRYVKTTEPMGYIIVSAGSDGRFDAEPTEYRQGATTKFDCDIVLANGAFVLYPETVQAAVGGQ
jgi:general secretion pathway protein G